MIAVVQRVSKAGVTVAESEYDARIERGLMVLLCIEQQDTPEEARWMAAKIAKLRVFEDEDQRFNLSIKDVAGSVLLVSQFTLAADTSRGTRPGFSRAAKPDQAKTLYEDFVACVDALGIHVQTGSFGADMSVALTNNGPVTLWLDTENP